MTLIGWDDDYPAANFRETPPGNGAFLCKNSWGAFSGTNGCLWISYHDDCFAYMASAAYPRPEATNNYGHGHGERLHQGLHEVRFRRSFRHTFHVSAHPLKHYFPSGAYAPVVARSREAYFFQISGR